MDMVVVFTIYRNFYCLYPYFKSCIAARAHDTEVKAHKLEGFHTGLIPNYTQSLLNSLIIVAGEGVLNSSSLVSSWMMIWPLLITIMLLVVLSNYNYNCGCMCIVVPSVHIGL